MATVFLNGRFITQDEASVSAFDAGFQHGVGLFETMSARLEDGRAEIFRLEHHLQRLIDSAGALGLTDRLRIHALAEAVGLTVERSGLARARVRLTVTGGDLNMLARAASLRRGGSASGGSEEPQAEASDATRGSLDPTVLIVAQPATEYPPEMFERGITAAIADTRINPLDPMSGHKTLNYWGRLRELQAAAARRAGEAIVFTVTNHIAGGCVSNIFVYKDNELLTPIARGEEEAVAAHEMPGSEGERASPKTTTGAVLPSPVLPGITRGWVMEWAAQQQVGVAQRMLTIHELLGADEVFLTNSSWGVLPVVRVEREEIGAGVVGGLAADLRRAWLIENGAR
jgi:branched-chain amino acid aminotransferase